MLPKKTNHTISSLNFTTMVTSQEKILQRETKTEKITDNRQGNENPVLGGQASSIPVYLHVATTKCILRNLIINLQDD